MNMTHQIPAFIFSGYQFIVINQPKFSIKSDDILNKGGPADVVNAVLESLGLDKNEDTILCGYDEGANIALKMAS
jgi:predicted esterase